MSVPIGAAKRFYAGSTDLSFKTETGTPTGTDRFVDHATGTAIVTSFHAFHTGAYLGVINRIVPFLSSVTMPLFAVTGLLRYFGRRKRKRKNQRERDALA